MTSQQDTEQSNNNSGKVEDVVWELWNTSEPVPVYIEKATKLINELISSKVNEAYERGIQDGHAAEYETHIAYLDEYKMKRLKDLEDRVRTLKETKLDQLSKERE